MTSTEARQAEDDIEPGSLNDLWVLQRDFEDFSGIGIDSQEKLRLLLSGINFTERLVAGLKKHGHEAADKPGYFYIQHGSFFTDLSDDLSNRGLAEILRMGNGRDTETGLGDYLYQVVIPLEAGDETAAGVMDSSRPMDIYAHDGDNVWNCAFDAGASNAAKVLSAALDDFVKAAENSFSRSQTVEDTVRSISKSIAAELGEDAAQRLNPSIATKIGRALLGIR